MSAAAMRVLRETPVRLRKRRVQALDVRLGRLNGLATAQQELETTEAAVLDLDSGLVDPRFAAVAEQIKCEIRKVQRQLERLEARIRALADERRTLVEDRKRAGERLTRLEATAAGLGAA